MKEGSSLGDPNEGDDRGIEGEKEGNSK